MEDPFASIAAIFGVSTTQESQFSSSDQNSGDELGPRELSSGSDATESETDHGGDDYIFHTPPEASLSVSDNEVFHTPTRASSSLHSSQEVAQPEEIINGAVRLDDRTEESVGDSEDTVLISVHSYDTVPNSVDSEDTFPNSVDSEDTVPISVDLEAEADLSSCVGDSQVEFPDAVDRAPENEVIHCESVRSRDSEVESVLIEKSNSPGSNRSELNESTRIIRLKESLQKLQSLSEKQDNWMTNSRLENRKASLGNMDCEEKLFISSGMNVIFPDASIDCYELRETVEKNSKIDDGRFNGGKRKLAEFVYSEENVPDLEYNLDSLEHTDEFNQACYNGEAADTVDKHILPVKARIRVRFRALYILKILAQQESDHHHHPCPRFKATSFVEIAKIRGMTFP